MKPLSSNKQSNEYPSGVAGSAPRACELRSSNPAEALTHDFDGNMKGGIAYDFVWDGEPRRLAGAEMDSRRLPAGRASRGARESQNRLIEATPKNPAALNYRFFCTYDYLGRRVTKHTHIWYEGEWYPDLESVEKMFYEGWNVVYRENDSWGAANVEHYTWGLDLSGSLQGAGGVGGLLAVHHFPGYGSGSDYWYQFDGNGNVSELMDFTGGVYMHYEYDPFGRNTNNSPTWRNGDWNPFTFSTKYMDRLHYNDLSQAPGTVFKEPLYYYGYRHYSPELGRWLSRDPIGESGGENLYGFVNNDGVNRSDYLGMWTINRNSKYSRAWVTSEQGDTFRALARELRLDPAEIEKWLRPKPGLDLDGSLPYPCFWQVPNTISVYTSKSVKWYFDAAVTAANSFRRAAGRIEKSLKHQGFNVITHYQESDASIFEEMWEAEGVYGVVFAGHGTKFGFVSDPVNDEGSDATDVNPPYSLAAIIAMSCYSADGVNIGFWPDPDNEPVYSKWTDHLAPGGLFLGFEGLAFQLEKPVDGDGNKYFD